MLKFRIFSLTSLHNDRALKRCMEDRILWRMSEPSVFSQGVSIQQVFYYNGQKATLA